MHTLMHPTPGTPRRLAPPARRAHSWWYWLTIGWVWSPTKWLGRVALWLLCWPLGLWRSWVHHHATQAARLRRGQR